VSLDSAVPERAEEDFFFMRGDDLRSESGLLAGYSYATAVMLHRGKSAPKSIRTRVRESEPGPLPADIDQIVQEIERKFIVTHLPAEVRRLRGTEIAQGYLAWGSNGREVRVRRMGAQHFLTVKSSGKLMRSETEVRISPRQFAALWPATRGARVAKRRSRFPLGEVSVEVDIYSGRLRGLIVAEIEFKTEKEARDFAAPSWFGREVTRDRRYRNQVLATTRGKLPW
jgi:adenylate cyclase